MKYSYTYCSNCGDEFDKVSDKLYLCPKCDFRVFISPKPAVGVFLFNYQNKLLMLRRTYDPGKGLWGIPGGFIDLGENAISALKREVLEETGLKINNFEYFGSFSGNYLYKGVNYKTVDIIYSTRIDGEDIVISDDESSEYRFFDISEITLEMIGTEDVKEAISELIHSKLH